MITWDVLAIAGGMTVLVVLFMGPGMWSSDTEFVFVRMWQKWRARKQPAGEDASESSQSPQPSNEA